MMGGAAGPRGLWGFIRGGMGAISQALAASAEAEDVEILTQAEVDRVLIKDGQAYGVVLKNGDDIRAKVIVSNADPKRTFLKLVEEQHLEEDFRRSVENFRVEGCSVKINLALDGLPNFTAFPNVSDREPGLPHKTTMHVCPSMDYVDRAWEDAKQGRPSQNPMLECTIPTAYDDSLFRLWQAHR